MKPRTMILAMILISLPAFLEARMLRPGKWRLSVAMEKGGQSIAAPLVVTECITPQEADDPMAALQRPSESCKIVEFESKDRTITWTISCPDEKMTGKGKITYADEKYEGSGTMTVGDQVVLQKYTGERIGECEPQ